MMRERYHALEAELPEHNAAIVEGFTHEWEKAAADIRGAREAGHRREPDRSQAPGASRAQRWQCGRLSGRVGNAEKNDGSAARWLASITADAPRRNAAFASILKPYDPRKSLHSPQAVQGWKRAALPAGTKVIEQMLDPGWLDHLVGVDDAFVVPDPAAAEFAGTPGPHPDGRSGAESPLCAAACGDPGYYGASRRGTQGNSDYAAGLRRDLFARGAISRWDFAWLVVFGSEPRGRMTSQDPLFCRAFSAPFQLGSPLARSTSGDFPVDSGQLGQSCALPVARAGGLCSAPRATVGWNFRRAVEAARGMIWRKTLKCQLENGST